MKQIAIVALLGLTNAFKIDKANFNPLHDNDFVVLWAESGAHPVATVWNKDHPHPGYPANWDDYGGREGFGTYDRKIPENFEGPGSGDD